MIEVTSGTNFGSIYFLREERDYMYTNIKYKYLDIFRNVQNNQY